jgi:hypothetical protein
MALTGSGENINKQLQAENEHLKKLIDELENLKIRFPMILLKKHWKQEGG